MSLQKEEGYSELIVSGGNVAGHWQVGLVLRVMYSWDLNVSLKVRSNKILPIAKLSTTLNCVI